MIAVDNRIKEAYNQYTTQRKSKIISGNNEYFIQNMVLFADAYDEGNIIGNAIAKTLSFDIDTEYVSGLDEFELYDGILIGEDYEYIYLGTFKLFEEQGTDEFFSHITAYDNLIKFNELYNPEMTSYPTTIYGLLQNICEQAGVTLATQSIANGTQTLSGNVFVEGETLKDVLKAICQISGTFAMISNDELHLKLQGSDTLTLNKYQLNEPEYKRTTWKWNQVVLGMQDIIGEYVLKQDDEDVEENGVHRVVINNNPFVYTQDLRQQYIDELFEAVKGFGYVAYETNWEGLPYVELGDIVTIDGNESIVLRYEIKSPDGLNSSIQAPSIIDSVIDYVNNADDLDNKMRRTEYRVDKAEGNITQITKTTEDIRNDLNNGYYTKIQTDELVQNSATGVTNTFSEAGGNNIFHNTGLWFENNQDQEKEASSEDGMITINDATIRPLEEINVYGKSEQNNSHGKNLLINSFEIVKMNNTTGTWSGRTYTINNVVFTYNSDGSITANGTASANTIFYINSTSGINTRLENGTYYFTSHETTGSNSTWKLQFNVGGTSYNVYGSGNNKELSITVSDNRIRTATIIIYSGQTVNNVTFYPMVSKKNGIDYEQYVGGETPNPQYPEKIKTINGIDNIFDGSLSTGYWNPSTKVLASTSNEIYKSFMMKVMRGKYTISFDVNVNIVRAFTDYNSSIDIIFETGSIATNITSYTMDVLQDTNLYISFRRNDNTVWLNSSKVQLEYSDTAHRLVPYGYWLPIKISNSLDTSSAEYESQEVLLDLNKYSSGSIVGHYELYSLLDGSIKDVIKIENGRVTLTKNINQIILNGEETWQRYFSNNIKRFYTQISDEAITNKGICNYFKLGEYDNRNLETENDKFFIQSSNNLTYLQFRFDELQTSGITGFKEWLSNNNTKVYYQLATPQIITLSGTYNFETYQGNNYITILDDDVIPEFDVRYLTNFMVYDFWNGEVEKVREEQANSEYAMLLKSGSLYQEQSVPNGNYTVSFKYKKLEPYSNPTVKINNDIYELNEMSDIEFITGKKDENDNYITQPLVVDTQNIRIEFETDADDSCLIYDLMVNAGTVKLAYSQNQNETKTDTVNISKGITITSNISETTFKANSDGIRTLDKTGRILTEFTDRGMITKQMVVTDESQLVGLLIQEVGEQTWLTKL